MKLKFLQFECEFGKDDAKIVIPLILLLLAFIFTALAPLILILLGCTYYLIFFFGKKISEKVQSTYFQWIKLRCPHCKSRQVFLQGYQGYKSDEHYPYYFCSHCHETSVLIDSGLIISYTKKPSKLEKE